MTHWGLISGLFIPGKPGTAFDRKYSSLHSTMATAHAIHSVRKALLALALLVSVTTACKKSGLGGADVDPRDQYVGTYEGGYQAASTVNNALPYDEEAGTMAVTVSKSQAANQLYIELVFNATTKQNLTAELVNNEFKVIDKQNEPIKFNGRNYDGQYSATGQFVEKAITINTVTETLQSGVTLTRRGSISGTRK